MDTIQQLDISCLTEAAVATILPNLHRVQHLVLPEQLPVRF